MHSIYLTPSTMRFSEIIGPTLQSLKDKNKWKDDLRQRTAIAERFAWVTGDKPLCDYTEADIEAYPLQTHEMLFDALTQAFRVLGGVPHRGIFDNMKTAVDKVGTGKARQVNARFAALASHYLFEPEFCNPAAGWEKGQVEKNVQDARRRLWQRMPAFADLEALNAWLEEQCIAQWAEIVARQSG